jgi:hypothetical protein
MNLIRVRDNIPQWPYTVAMLRADEPRLSISQRPHAGELAALQTLDPPIYVYAVEPTERPAHDRTQQTLKQVHPVLADGVWQQRWEVVDLPPAPPQDPEPQWVAFGAALAADAGVNALVAAARDNAPVLHLMLGVGLGQAAQGDPQTFSAAWATARQTGLASPELIEQMQVTAATFNLPAEFIEGLAA